jgi:hypothetical protein
LGVPHGEEEEGEGVATHTLKEGGGWAANNGALPTEAWRRSGELDV